MRVSRIAVTVFVIAILAGSTPVYAKQHQGNNLNLTFDGMIMSSGDQAYSVEGGHMVAGFLHGQAIDPSKANLEYDLQAHVTGLSAGGEADFSFTATGADGSTTKVKGVVPIVSMFPAEFFPLGCTLGSTCSSGVPFVFQGLASVSMQTCPSQSDQTQTQGQGGSGSGGNGKNQDNECSKASHLTLPMQLESAFMNPFGGPIFMASVDNLGNPDLELLIIASYSQARVTWTGIQLGGTVIGNLAGTPVSGSFGMQVSAVEDLKAGNEVERGTISLSGMTPDSLNAAGHFDGKSTIPPGSPCGFPPPFDATCQVTGFNSQGDFSMQASKGGSIKGSYTTVWTAPAVMFTSSVTATFNSGH